jgi:hypothetical protein
MILPLSATLLVYAIIPLSATSPPLTSMAKGYSPWSYASLYRRDDRDITSSFCLRYSNVSLRMGLVKIFATLVCIFSQFIQQLFATRSLVVMYSILKLFSITCSLRKWYLIGICSVFECITQLFEMLISLVLLQMIEIILSYSTLISFGVFFI